jgi:hypothetical protein
MCKKIMIFLFIVIAFPIFAHPKFDQNNRSGSTYDYEEIRADSAHGFDVLNYDITIDIDDQDHYIEGTVIATVVAEETLTEMQYELESLNINQIQVNGVDASYDYSNGIITIELGTIIPGEQFTTSVSYSGYPVQSNDIYHLGMIFSSSYVFTLSDPSGCRWWWPAYDHPWDKAEVDFHVTMRDDWLVACNGIRTDIIDNGDGTKTHHWDGSNPMATFLPCISAANFVELNQDYNGLLIQNFVTPGQYDNALIDFQNLPLMVEIYTEKYGVYPFEKYGNAVVPMVTFGAMEHQTMTTLGSYIITGALTYETVIAHELSHQWFGNCLTPLTWADVWLSEGFAVYSEAIFTEELYGYEEFIDYVIYNIQNYYLSWTGGGSYTIYDPSYNNYFTPVTYEKAASVLHMLRITVGNNTFFEILQTYFETYHNQNVVTSEFREICENVSGMNLEQFFQQWIFEPGIPSMEYTYFINAGAATTEILTYVKTLSNTNTDFYIRVPFHVNYGTEHESVLVDASPDIPAETISEIISPAYTSVGFDPESWIISWGNTYYPIQINNAYAADDVVIVYWTPFWEDIEIDGFDVYRSLEPENNFVKINIEIITDTYFVDNDVVNGTTYYYRVKAIKNEIWETDFSDYCEAMPFEFPFDQGVLVIDETMDGPGVPGNPDDEMVDTFYQNVVSVGFTEYDYETEGLPSVEYLANFSTILWHDDDLPQHFINNNLQNLGCYLISGGNLIVSGWKTAHEISDYFIRDFLYCDEVQLANAFEFLSASSEEYPDLYLDEEKLSPAFNGTLPFVCIFPEAGNGIYNYEGIEGSIYQDEICALKSQDYGAFIFLGFPLYYFFEEDVLSFLDQVFEELGETPVSHEIVKENVFYTNVFPNPFNPAVAGRSSETTITYSLKETSLVSLEIYNIKGQRINTLVNKEMKAGTYNVKWNGKDFEGRDASSGIYFYKFKAGDNISCKKMVLIR